MVVRVQQEEEAMVADATDMATVDATTTGGAMTGASAPAPVAVAVGVDAHAALCQWMRCHMRYLVPLHGCYGRGTCGPHGHPFQMKGSVCCHVPATAGVIGTMTGTGTMTGQTGALIAAFVWHNVL